MVMSFQENSVKAIHSARALARIRNQNIQMSLEKSTTSYRQIKEAGDIEGQSKTT